MKKNAQMEIAGLLIIVVLVSIVFMFVLTFNVSEREKGGNIQQRTQDSQIRDNFGPVLLETNTDCQDKTVRDLLADCGSVNEIECVGESGNSKISSCIKAHDVIKKIIEKTLEEQGYKYKLSVKKKQSSPPSNKVISYKDATNDDKEMLFENDCNSKNSEISIIPFETDHGTMTLIFKQC